MGGEGFLGWTKIVSGRFWPKGVTFSPMNFCAWSEPVSRRNLFGASAVAALMRTAFPEAVAGEVGIIVATTTIAADAVRRVMGAELPVKTLMGPGVDPHLYRARPSDLLAVKRARVLVHHGLGLEGRLGELVAAAAKGAVVVDLGKGVPRQRLIFPEPGSEVADPHAWGDPTVWTSVIEHLERTLANAGVIERAAAESGFSTFKTAAERLVAWGRGILEKVPESGRVLVTSHDAFNYFGRAFGLKVVGLQGLSTVAEAGVADVNRLTAFIRKQGVKAVFVESSVPPAAMKRIAELAGVRVGGELFSDSLGAFEGAIARFGTDEESVGGYLGMMRHNLRTVAEGLA